MVQAKLRLKIELALAATIGIAGVIAGTAYANPSGWQKPAVIALASATTGFTVAKVLSGINDKTGVLEREITRLTLAASAMQKRLNKEYEDAAALLATIEQLNTVIALHDFQDSEMVDKVAQAESHAKQWCLAAQSASETAKALAAEVKALESELAQTESDHIDKMVQLDKSHRETIHKEVKKQVTNKAQKTFAIYKERFEALTAETQAQHELELSRYQGRIEELSEAIAQLQAQLEATGSEKTQLTTAFEELTQKDLPDIQQTFEREWMQNDQLLQAAIEQLQKANAELQAPRQFSGLTNIDAIGNKIIQHFAAYGVVLDAIESVSIPVGFRLRFKFDRTEKFTALTEAEFDKRCSEPGLMGLSHAPLDFAFDARNFIISVDIATGLNGAAGTTQPATAQTATEAIELASGDTGNDAAFRALGCFPASDFETVIREKFVPRVRVVAGSTGGKSPLMELIAVAIAKINSAELWLLNPLPGSPKDWFSVPGLVSPGKDGIQQEIEWLETAHRELGKRRENLGGSKKFIMVMADEVNALARDYENLGVVLKDFYQLSDHAAMGIITAGQGANVSGVSGGASKKATGNAGKLMEEDFQNATQVFTAQAAKVWLKKHSADLLPKLTELEKLCTSLNESEGLSARPKPGTKIVDRHAYRIALVVSPATDEPFFIQIPAYSFYADKLDGVDFPRGAMITAPYENQVALGLAANPDECPKCGSGNTKVNKSLKASIKRVCGDCNHYYNVPKSAAEKV